MDYEKAYKEALERAKKVLLDCTSEERKVVEYAFPQLAESDDERIRKAIVLGIKRCADAGSIFGTVINNEGVNYHDVLTYLEKQKDANKEYWRGYLEGKQEILDKYTEIEKQKEQNTEPFSCGHENGGNSEQPDVDIRKELGRVELMGSNNASDMQHIAIHFYKLGLNARKEESK